MPSPYGAFVATGCITAVLWLWTRRDRLGLSDNAFWAAIWIMVLGATIGAKTLFVVLGWEHYARGQLRLWGDFGVGFVFFGGLLGATVAGWGLARWHGLGFVGGADYFAVAVPMGHAIGRIGCFVTGCCGGHPPHPVQLYEAAGLGLITWGARAALARVETARLPPGSAFWLYLLLYAVLRIALDPLRADGRPERLLGLSPQQGLALVVVAVALAGVALSSRQVARARGAGMKTSLRRLGVLTAVLGLAVSLGACVTRVPVPIAVHRGSADPPAAWARVLGARVLDDGRIDFVGLRDDPGDLASYVAWLASHGPATTPRLFPTPAAELAYYINAYNALAMHQVVATERRPEQKLRFFLLSAFMVDGGRASLHALESRVIRPRGDPRVHFALNCMVRGCPRLPREPFDPVRLDAQLDCEARRFLAEPRNVQVDPPLRAVRLSSILRFYREDFLQQAPSLVDYVNRYRREPIPADYRVDFIPYDWTLHQR